MTPADRPLVSVFTPAFEIGANVVVPLLSLLAQTYDNWEWVVVDESDSWETADHLEGLAASPAAAGRVRVHRSASGGSIGASKAAATRQCRGSILVELDHDDELLPDALDMVVATFASRPGLDFVYSDWIDRLDDDDVVLYPPGWAHGFGAHAYELVNGRYSPVALSAAITWETVRHIVSVPNHLRAWRAESYRRLGGHDPSIPVGDDFELLVRTFLAGTMGHVPRPLYIQHHSSTKPSASRAWNDAIQDRVALVVRAQADALDARCRELGLTPHAAGALTGTHPLSVASERIDPVSESRAVGGRPLVSVIFPVARGDRGVDSAIEAVLGQTYPTFELLVLGDCAENVVAAADPRIRFWDLGDEADCRAAENYARNAMVRGTVVTTCHSGQELWPSGYLERLLQSMTVAPD